MTPLPQVSVVINSAYRLENGKFRPMRVTLEGREIELRSSILCAVKVNLDDLLEALSILEKAKAVLPPAESREGRP